MVWYGGNDEGDDMQSLGGRPTDRNQTHSSWFPGRPADGPEPRRAKPVPKHVQGHSLGGGGKRTQPANDGCLVMALVLAGGIFATIGGAVYGLVEVGKAVL